MWGQDGQRDADEQPSADEQDAHQPRAMSKEACRAGVDDDGDQGRSNHESGEMAVLGNIGSIEEEEQALDVGCDEIGRKGQRSLPSKNVEVSWFARCQSPTSLLQCHGRDLTNDKAEHLLIRIRSKLGRPLVRPC